MRTPNGGLVTRNPGPGGGSIDERAARGSAVITRSEQHRRRERLAERRLPRSQPVAAPVEQRARAVGTDGDHVAEDPDDEQLLGRISRSSVVLIFAGAAGPVDC